MTKVWVVEYQFNSWREDEWRFIGVFSDPEPVKQLIWEQHPDAYDWNWKHSICNEKPMWTVSCKEIIFDHITIMIHRLTEHEIDELLED